MKVPSSGCANAKLAWAFAQTFDGQAVNEHKRAEPDMRINGGGCESAKHGTTGFHRICLWKQWRAVVVVRSTEQPAFKNKVAPHLSGEREGI